MLESVDLYVGTEILSLINYYADSRILRTVEDLITPGFWFLTLFESQMTSSVEACSDLSCSGQVVN